MNYLVKSFFLNLFLILILTPISHAFKTDVGFEVEKAGYNQIRLKAFENSKLIFDRTVCPDVVPEFNHDKCSLITTDQGMICRYQGSDLCNLTFAINKQADITLIDCFKNTHYEQQRSWSFKTSGKFLNEGVSSFYKLKIQAEEMHNLSLLKCFQAKFKSNYYFNQGIMHFGEDKFTADMKSYLESGYLGFLRPNLRAKPSYEKGLIDDCGVILAEKGLHIKSLTHRIQGYVEADFLKLDQASIDLQQKGKLHVKEEIQGQAPSFNIGPYAEVYIGSISRLLKIQNWTNEGNIFLNKTSELNISQKMSNKGYLISFEDLLIKTDKLPKFLGCIISGEDIEFIIKNSINYKEFEIFVSTGMLMAPTNKIKLSLNCINKNLEASYNFLKYLTNYDQIKLHYNNMYSGSEDLKSRLNASFNETKLLKQQVNQQNRFWIQYLINQGFNLNHINTAFHGYLKLINEHLVQNSETDLGNSQEISLKILEGLRKIYPSQVAYYEEELKNTRNQY